MADEVLDLLGGLGGALREASHLGGDHREAAALLARARRLDGRVQREDVGLEGDGVDHRDDVGDAPGALADVAHGGHDVDHLGAALLGTLGRGARQVVGLTRVVGVLPHRAGKLLHAGGGLLEAGSLLLGALREVGGAGGDLAGRGDDRFRGGAHLAHHLAQRILHLGKRADQLADLVLRLALDLGGEVALLDALGEDRGVANRGQHGLAHEEPEHDQRGQHHAHGADDRRAVAGLRGIDRLRGGLGARLDREALRVLEVLRGGTVDARHRCIARLRIELRLLERLEARPVALARGLVRGAELLELGEDGGVADSGARLAHRIHRVLFLLEELAPVLVERLGVLAAQEDVLPFLHLVLEIDERLQQCRLRLEILAADAVELLDGSVHAREGKNRNCEGYGHRRSDERKDFELQAGSLHCRFS